MGFAFWRVSAPVAAIVYFTAVILGSYYTGIEYHKVTIIVLLTIGHKKTLTIIRLVRDAKSANTKETLKWF
ncbi:hypothetical protein LC20_07100 [Yersinia hibernica]|uniref:Uncharacterized protein n=1 Tax=Yersinia enterocolitica LC20 TaxID=1443113 RepID=A0A7U5SSK7_YEREN|nr:hypothetical protein LC20_07100 [Yersinia hibernica]OVZ75932.1 hypothetical protein CBW54_22075 [Yersinia kristensenii]